MAAWYGRERGYGLSSYVDGLQSAGRIEEALAITEESVAVARDLGNPYWIVLLWIAGMAFSHTEPRRALAAWDEGMSVVREQRVQFFEGFIARDVRLLDAVRRRARRRPRVVRRGDRRVPARRNDPQLIITLASVPALFSGWDGPSPPRPSSARWRTSRRLRTTSPSWRSSATGSNVGSARSAPRN